MPLKQTTGSRAQVMHGTAKKTTGGLTKSQLKYNNQGKIVSKKASALAKKNNRLVKAGYVTKKGQFGVSMRGGACNDEECSDICGKRCMFNCRSISERKCCSGDISMTCGKYSSIGISIHNEINNYLRNHKKKK